MNKKTKKIQIRVFQLGLLLSALVSSFTISAMSTEKAANKAVSVRILKSAIEKEISGKKAHKGHIFLILETEWENIHPKQKVEKAKLEGKTDRTMGVGTLAGRKKTETEYVEVDVAYQVRKLFDHVYLLADGLAYPLHKITEKAPEGVKLQETFAIAKQGEKRKASFVYHIPESATNLGFQFFDYQYGHIILPVQGDLGKAQGSGKPSGNVLGQVRADQVEIAAHSLGFQNTYAEEQAPKGWQFAVLQISGKSLSGKTVKDIVQIKPTEYTWVTTEGGYLYYAQGGTTTDQDLIRFTPEIYQHQELAFLVPKSARVSQLGIRIRNDVFQLPLTDSKSQGKPKALSLHRDGDVMEVMIFGMRRENGNVIMDLGIQSLASSGIEIQRKAQFMLVVDENKISLNDDATDRLLHHPPSPFVIPPKTFVRFELNFQTEGTPSTLYYRGYQSENYFKLKSLMFNHQI